MHIPNILFRTEEYSGSKVRKLTDIIEHEISELRNKDIPQYVLNHYADYIPETLRHDLQAILGEDPAGKYPFLGGVADRDDLRKLIDGMIDAVSAVLGQNVKDGRRVNALRLEYGLWLATLDAVSEHYFTNRGDGSAQAYSTASRTLYYPEPVVLSDLGDEGVLLAFADEPKPLPDPVRYELWEWPDSQAVMGLPFALPADHPEFDSAWLFPQDYIEGADGQEPVLGEPYYRIAWPFAQKAEEALRAGDFKSTDLVHAADCRDVFVSQDLLNRLVDPEGKFKVEVVLALNFLNPATIEQNVSVTPANQTESDGGWMHYFEFGGHHSYASNYGYGINIRLPEDGTTDEGFAEMPDDNEHKRIYLACKELGLPCGNITFNF